MGHERTARSYLSSCSRPFDLPLPSNARLFLQFGNTAGISSYNTDDPVVPLVVVNPFSLSATFTTQDPMGLAVRSWSASLDGCANRYKWQSVWSNDIVGLIPQKHPCGMAFQLKSSFRTIEHHNANTQLWKSNPVKSSTSLQSGFIICFLNEDLVVTYFVIFSKHANLANPAKYPLKITDHRIH